MKHLATITIACAKHSPIPSQITINPHMKALFTLICVTWYMFGFHQKIIRKVKRQYKMPFDETKISIIRLMAEIGIEIIRLGISNNSKYYGKGSNETVDNFQEQIGKISWDMEILRKNQKEVLEVKNIVK